MSLVTSLNKDSDFVNAPRDEVDLVPTFSNLKLEFTNVINNQTNLCKVCNEPILVERKAHPDVHTACLSSSRSSSISADQPKTSASSSQHPTTCTFCQKRIIIKYRDHPTLHTTCKAALARGETPPTPPPCDGESKKSRTFDDIFDGTFLKQDSHFDKAFGMSSTLSPRKERELHPDFTDRLADLSTEDLLVIIENASDYYEVLGVNLKSPFELIKSNYKRLAMRLHPDKCMDGTEAFKKVSHAFAVLSNEESRRRYDLARRSGTSLQELSPADLERCRAFVRVTDSDIRNVSGMLDKLFEELNKALFGGPH